MSPPQIATLTVKQWKDDANEAANIEIAETNLIRASIFGEAVVMKYISNNTHPIHLLRSTKSHKLNKLIYVLWYIETSLNVLIKFTDEWMPNITLTQN